MTIATLILAAGLGTRMKSKLAKVLHPVGGRPMVVRAVESAAAITGALPYVVVGNGADQVRSQLGDRAHFVVQSELRGTGHAVLQAADLLRGRADQILVFAADMPLLRPDSFQLLRDAQAGSGNVIELLTVVNPNPRGFGRIVRRDGAVVAIVEESDATDAQKLITELNAAVYVFDAAWLWANLPKIQPNPKKGEYYLTDLVQIAVEQGRPVGGHTIADLDEVIGVNTRVDLADCEAALRRRVIRQLQLDGVTIVDPATTYIEDSVTIGQDSVIAPNTHLTGQTAIGADCIIGPNCIIADSKIGDACSVRGSVVENTTIENRVTVGPYAHLRANAYLSEGVHMGNFGEVKNSTLGRDTKMGHFSYVGDARIGANVNIGAGVVTANFDGVNKHQTIVGDGAFLGSDTILRAPVTIGPNSRTGAGAVVTHDVPPDHVAIGVPARNRATNDH